MPNSFVQYRIAGHRFVQGWLEPEVLDILGVLDFVQRDHDISGGVAEIGVHHGRFFIGLHLLLRDHYRSLAIDIFDDQHLNRDLSGRGDLDKFRLNVKRWASSDNLVIHQGDSTKLDGAAVQQLIGSPVRLFSIDGGHTEDVVLADMALAETALAAGGVAIADDVFNQRWPGVVVGTVRYLRSGAGLAPFAIGFNKVFFTQPAYVDLYRGAIEARYSTTMRISVEKSVFAGHQVAVLFPTRRTPRWLLRKNPTARALYRRLVR